MTDRSRRSTTIPEPLVAIGEILGLTNILEIRDVERNQPRRTGWTASRAFKACWPIPDGSVSFGKGSSCIVGEEIAVSCAEVELALAAKSAGWDGGWVRGYGLDSRVLDQVAVVTIQDARSARAATGA